MSFPLLIVDSHIRMYSGPGYGIFIKRLFLEFGHINLFGTEPGVCHLVSQLGTAIPFKGCTYYSVSRSFVLQGISFPGIGAQNLKYAAQGL